MADSDEDLFDDIELDADALAEIDAHTTQYITQGPSRPVPTRVQPLPKAPPPVPPLGQPSNGFSRPPPPAPAPQPKRRRTPNGWVSAGQGGTSYDTDDEDLPDITIREDGSYSAAPVQPSINRQQNVSRPTPANKFSSDGVPGRASIPPTLPNIPHSPPAPMPVLAPIPAPVPAAAGPARFPPVQSQLVQAQTEQVQLQQAYQRTIPGGPPRLGMRPRPILPPHQVQQPLPPATTQQSASQRPRPSRTLSAVQAALAAPPPAPTQSQAPGASQTQRMSRTLSQVQAAMADPSFQTTARADSPQETNLAALQHQLAEVCPAQSA
jgi:hypothetical protein